MRRYLPVILLAAAAVAQANVFKCTKDGRTIFQDTPCANAAVTTKTVVTQSEVIGGIDWSLLKSGMSVDEVKGKSGNLRDGRREKLSNGAVGLLGLGMVKIEDVSFDAQLYFLNGGFLRINYATPLEKPLDNDLSLQHFEHIAAVYRRKFGEPVKREVKQKSLGVSADASWEIPGATVNLGIMPLTSTTSILLTSYVPR